jgi:hypothetical protein
LLDLIADDLLAFGVELVRATFQKEQAEDVILVGGGIESFLAKPVGGGVEVAFELGKGEAGRFATENYRWGLKIKVDSAPFPRGIPRW